MRKGTTTLLVLTGLGIGAYYLFRPAIVSVTPVLPSGTANGVLWRIVPVAGFADTFESQTARPGFGFVRFQIGQDVEALKLAVLEHIATGGVPG